MQAVIVLGIVAIILSTLIFEVLKQKRAQKEVFTSQLAPIESNYQPKMFMFAENQCNPSCCPGQFSCSGGCVCMTKQQETLLASRGNNSSYLKLI
jgi:hypothetical protein